ncbi:MAG TPA: cob(I)yrinic acid a,c-diamide adenosyltransferase [Rhodocyclaceae bacterium]|nr:cob(I)yrinic acid a,c-diamide adenosyltransferase [Rhodocyclaceae bacterium]
MANRLSRITTRTGDDGTTGLGDGSRVAKSNLRIHALGDIDELNSAIGLLLAEAMPEKSRAILVRMQHDLFDLGGEISIPGYALIGTKHIETIESHLGELNASLTPLKEFILPGGNRPAALAHLARTIARRAERTVVALAATESVRPEAIQYLNRASDLLFVIARWLNRESGGSDVLWQHERK